MDIEKKIENTKLYLVYQNLLTDKQKKYMEMYILEDFSLGEIASSENVSRNAVFDQIKKTIALLNSIEEKLALVSKENLREEIMEELDQNFSYEIFEKLKNIK